MINRTKLLNWAIWVYIAIMAFGYSKIIEIKPSLKILFVLVPISLMLWEIILLSQRFIEKKKKTLPNYHPLVRHLVEKENEDSTNYPFYEYFETGDWWRIFGILWIGHRPFASDYLLGFLLFSVIVLLVFCILAFTASVDYFRKKTITPLVIGCLFFMFYLLVWEKNTYVIHYGVPIIEHFFEKPEYYTKYQVEIQPNNFIFQIENFNNKIEAIADIHVKSRMETENYGEEDIFGQPLIYTYTYKDVWVEKLYLPNGETLTIEDQYGTLPFKGSILVKDSYENWWKVYILDKPIP